MHTVFIIIAVILIIFLIKSYKIEQYLPCNDCSQIPKTRPVVVNPFIFPYSAEQCSGKLYNLSESPDNVFPTTAQLTNPSAPDHVIQTN